MEVEKPNYSDFCSDSEKCYVTWYEWLKQTFITNVSPFLNEYSSDDFAASLAISQIFLDFGNVQLLVLWLNTS